MALLVQKFGGTSVGSIERIQKVARDVIASHLQGHKIVVVVSAMSGETNRLVGLASQITERTDSPDYDMIIASGEQVSVGLVALAINTEAKRRGLIPNSSEWEEKQAQGLPYLARGFLGHQIGILTDPVFSKARIQTIRAEVLHEELKKSRIPVVAGFQGVNADNQITTLGRGGSDTSAVAIAIAVGADECEIYTDVDGVYTTDPRICKDAQKISYVSYEEMLEMAASGSKVLQIRSVELAANYQMPVHVRSSFNSSEGTRVVSHKEVEKMKNSALEEVVVAGVASDKDQVKFTLRNVPDQPGVAAKIFGGLSKASVVVDVIVLDTPAQGRLTISFTAPKSDAVTAREALATLAKKDFPELQILEESGLAKVSIVGSGMQYHPGVASKMFSLLAEGGINIKLITTSEIKVSCLVEESKMNQAVQCLHQGFNLGSK